MTGKQISESEFESQSFRLAELRSEAIRIKALLGVFVILLFVVLVRGVFALLQGYRGEAWPFAVLLSTITAYEVLWLRFIRRTAESDRVISRTRWTGNILVESLLPTTALLLQVHAAFMGPERALTSPVLLGYLLLILLSTLHLSPGLCWLAGVFSAAGYAAVAAYVLIFFPEIAGASRLFAYSTFLSICIFLLAGGAAAAAVARQIRLHVVAALRDAENRAKIAQYQHDLGIARSIQQGLLPTTSPLIQGFDIAACNLPADETGGDYFDWQQLSDGRVAVTVADVTGHGIGSALIMSACRAYARAGFAAEPDLPRLLCRLNQLLHEDLPPEKFVTLAAGVLNPQYSTGHLISAGHGPLLFYSAAEDKFYNVDAQGPPLGLLPGFSYGGAQMLRFDAGDMLVLVTDGFIEWTNTNEEEFGQDRLMDVIHRSRNLPSAKIISEMHSAIVKFAGSMRQMDDLTALIVKRVSGAAPCPDNAVLA